MENRVLVLLSFLIFNFTAYTQNWTNLEYSPNQPGLEYNPLKGFATMWNPENNFPHSIQGKLFGLDDIMTGMNTFNWTVIDNFLIKNTADGIFSYLQVNIDPANGTTDMPTFLKNQVEWKTKPSSLCPDWNNEILMQAMLNFIAAYGERYNDDSRVFLVCLGLYGMWGEWHVGEDKTFDMTQANKTRLAKAYQTAFPDKQLLARYADAVPDPQIFGYSDGLFFSASIDANISNRWAFHNMLKINHADENWKLHVIGGEIDPALQANLWKSWPNTVGQDVSACLDSIHPTWLFSHHVLTKVSPSTAEWDNSIRAQKMLGYTFFVNQYRLTASQGKATIELGIQNKGLAPIYANWDIEIGVFDSSNQFKSLGIKKCNIDNILPDNKDHYRAITASTTILDGTYTVLMRIINPLEQVSSKAKPVRFANTTQDENKTGWLTLGEMTISEGVCGVSPIPVSGLTLSLDTITLTVGDKIALSATVSPSDVSRKNITWISDHPACVSVDSTGIATAGPVYGQSKITALTQDGGFEAKCVIFVEPAWVNIPAKLQAENYIEQSGVQTENCSDIGRGLNVGWIDDGDWMKYAINNESDSIYFSALFRYASTNSNNGIINVFLDSMQIGKVICPHSGGWQNWKSNSIIVKIGKGKHYLNLVAESGLINLNYIDFAFTADTISNNPGTGIGNIDYQFNDVQIYPIPASEYLKVTTGDWFFNKVEIADMTGKTVYSEEFDFQSNVVLPIDVNSGLYILQLRGRDKIISKLIVVKK